MAGSFVERIRRDVARITAMAEVPTFDADDEALSERITREITGLPTPRGGVRLFPIQAAALDRIRRERGGLLGVDVGGGKTLISMCAPAILDLQGSAVCFVPATLVEQTRSEYARWSEIFGVLPPEIMTYEAMSRKGQQKYLRERAPRLVILDEAHKLRDLGTTRTGRFVDFMEAYSPIVVAMSGSLSTTGKVSDYAHIAEWALGDRSPVPTSPEHLSGLDEAVGYAVRGAASDECLDTESAWRPYVKRTTFREPGTYRDCLRKAIRHRLHTHPGCVWSSASSCNQPLIGSKWTHPITERTEEALEGLAAEWVLPDGEELVSASDVALQSGGLPFGFYLRWEWEAIGGYDAEWNDARRGWARSVRGYLQYRNERVADSALLVEEGVRSGVIDDPTLISAWDAWERVKDREPPPPMIVWHDEEQADLAAEALANEPPGTLMWYTNQAMREIFRRAGIPCRGAGEQAPTDPSTSWGVSVMSHATGYNLQMFSRNLILQPPATPGIWQQLIGRTHRTGQQNPVHVAVCVSTDSQADRLHRALEGSRVIDTIHGSDWKLTKSFARG